MTARKNCYIIRANQEFLALGLINIVGSMFHSYPTTGSFSRSAIQSQSDVATPMAGLFTGCFVLVSVFFLTPVFVFVPKATLAAIIIVAVSSLVGKWSEFQHLWRIQRKFVSLDTFV